MSLCVLINSFIIARTVENTSGALFVPIIPNWESALIAEKASNQVFHFICRKLAFGIASKVYLIPFDSKVAINLFLDYQLS